MSGARIEAAKGLDLARLPELRHAGHQQESGAVMRSFLCDDEPAIVFDSMIADGVICPRDQEGSPPPLCLMGKPPDRNLTCRRRALG
jgi:hypothetical protein